MITAAVKSKRETAGLINLGTAVPRRNNIKYMQPPHHKIPLIALYVGMIKLSHTAGACFAVLSEEVSACFIHCFYYEVKRDLSRCGKEIGKVNGIYGTHCGYGIPLYTRNLHEAVYRVARKSQMMLYGVFGGILYLLKAHSEKLAESLRRHTLSAQGSFRKARREPLRSWHTPFRFPPDSRTLHRLSMHLFLPKAR